MENNGNDAMDYRLYVMAEIGYGKLCDEKGIPEEKRYPRDWYGTNDYRFKTNIIARALKYKLTIMELPEFALRADADEELRELCKELYRRFRL